MPQPALRRKACYTEHPILEKLKEDPFRQNCPCLGQRFRFVDQHDGDVIFDLVKQFALVADEAVSRFVQVDVPFAFGACQDIKKFFTDGHRVSPPIRVTV
jgi:hypothetical protein